MNNIILHVHPTVSTSSSILDLQQQLYLKMKDDKQERYADFWLWLALMYKFKKPASHVEPCRVDAFYSHGHEDHHDDDARPEGESSSQDQQEEFDAWVEDQGTNDDEVSFEEIPEKPSPVYHSCERDPNSLLMVLVNKDLFYLKNGNLETRKYVVEQWKNLWAKQSYIKKQLKTRADPDEVYSEQKIVDVIRILTNQGYGQNFMKEIVVKRADGEYNHFSKSDYKYIHKNDIEDMYLICLNGKIKYQETGILKSLNAFIRSCVILESDDIK
ncbi:hypothetical protein Tco_0595515 [Tanacetum coccineum]